MRITESMTYRSLIDNIGMQNERLEKAALEVSSGSRLNSPHDSPADSSELVRLEAQLAQLDQYQSNSEASGFFLHVTESALNSLHDLTTAIFTRGSEAGNSFNDDGVRATIATEIRSLRDQIFSLANTQIRGRYIFSGSLVTSPAFSITGDTVAYQGDGRINTIRISDGLEIEQNIPGPAAFSPVFSSIEELLTAVEAGDRDAIKAALEGFSSTFAEIGQVRTRLGVELGKLQDSEATRSMQETNIETRRAKVQDADMAKAISDLNMAQTALNATLAAGSMLGRRNLFDYLG